MKVLWLGQGGLLFVCGKKKIMIDPYLTNSLSLIDYTLDRKMKINRKIFNVRPDVMILTNCHPDHADIETISKFARKQKSKLTILSCESVFLQIADNGHCALANNIMLEPGSEWSIEGFNIQAVTAKTDDKSAIGVIITDTKSGKKYYVTGDTLYSKHVLKDLPNDIFAVFVPINGEYGSMNVIDAKRFALATNAKYAIPVHFGMLDRVSPESFDASNAIIPKIYRIIDFEAGTYTDNKEIDRKFNERESKSKPVEPVQISIDDTLNNDSDALDIIVNTDGGIELDADDDMLDEIELEPIESPVAKEARVEVPACDDSQQKQQQDNESYADTIEEAEDENEVDIEIEDIALTYDDFDNDDEAEGLPMEANNAINDVVNSDKSNNEADISDIGAEGDISDIEAEDNELILEDASTEPCDDDYDQSLSIAIEGGYDEELDAKADEYNNADDYNNSDDASANEETAEGSLDDSEPEADKSDEVDCEGSYSKSSYSDFDEDNDYSDFDDFDEDGEQLEFEPFTSEDLLAYCSGNEDEGSESDNNASSEADAEKTDSCEAEADDSCEAETDNTDDAETDNTDEAETDDADAGEDDASSTPAYTSRQASEQDEADLIDAFVKELEKLDRGETPDFSK